MAVVVFDVVLLAVVAFVTDVFVVVVFVVSIVVQIIELTRNRIQFLHLQTSLNRKVKISFELIGRQNVTRSPHSTLFHKAGWGVGDKQRNTN